MEHFPRWPDTIPNYEHIRSTSLKTGKLAQQLRLVATISLVQAASLLKGPTKYMPLKLSDQFATTPLSAVQILTSIEDESSGPTYSVVRLAEALAKRGAKSSVMSLASNAGMKERDGVKFYRFKRDHGPMRLPDKLAPSRELANAANVAARDGAVLHMHGLWRMPNIYPGFAAARAGTPLVLSPRGMLGRPALAFSKQQKRLFWHIWQKRALKALDCVHVTASSELDDVRAFGLTVPAAIIPNGIDVPEKPLTATKQGNTLRQVLHLGRIHPKKGIDRLLFAWSLLDNSQPDWELRIIGPSEGGHAEELQALARQLKIKNIRFEGPVYGRSKDLAYANAEVFILPTLNENFGMVVAEALAQGTPVISTKGAPWKGLISEHCGWWTDHDPEALAAAIKDAMALSSAERSKMGARGREWMQRDFSWDAIAGDMQGVYQWCAGQGERPECVVE